MYCKKCGTQNDDNAWQCISCGESVQPAAPSPTASASGDAHAQAVPNYLVQSILVTFATMFCCCFPNPFGIPAIVFATQVKSKLTAGDIAGAQDASKNAKLWCWIALGVDVPIFLINAIYIIVMIVVALTEA